VRLPEGEPAVRDWRFVSAGRLVDQLLERAGAARDRALVIAVDGRSASGKSTLAALIAQHVDGAVIVHTDDLAWHEPYFRWGHLLRDGVLAPLREGRGVELRPPQWVARSRGGAITVPQGAGVVVIEGVGATQREVTGLVDAAVWVQSDFSLAEQRGIARDIANGQNGAPEEAAAFWHEWMNEELAFLRRDRPWERADLVVAGTPPPSIATDEVAVADGPLTAA